MNHNPKKIGKVKIRFRHRQKLIQGKYEIKNKKIVLTYRPTLSVTPGQFAVLYSSNKCLGGGIVNKTFFKSKI
ncbi:MAG: hypothetical protein K2L48_04265 [Mycoplasmoidaceae bacterium]|nr:hypothetical protein [Mycoplasmoidaceae bacterium]